MKVIQPLFLDDLRAEFERLKSRRDTGRTNALTTFHDKLASLKFFDPACGCGNFLIIAYRELRQLETELLKELHPTGQRVLDIASLSKLNVNQFYGIEIFEFPARIAETALWMMDHIMNNRLSLEFGEAFVRIPLQTAPHIHCADALEIDWTTVLRPEECSVVYGNPPFGGAKFQTEKNREQIRRIANLGGSGGTLDYVCGWFLKAGQYVRASTGRIGFVATNSITQGEQAAQLWPLLFDRYGLEIAFAHRTFAWGSDARGKAHVHVVILGLVKREDEPKEKRLFSYDDIEGDPHESRYAALSPYLFDATRLSDRHLTVKETSRSLSGAPKLIIGSKPIDGGYLILNDEERTDFLRNEPNATHFIRPFIGSVDYIQGGGRWILALQSATPQQIRSRPRVKKCLSQVREYRLGLRPAKRKQDGEPKPPGISAKALAGSPAQFHVTVLPIKPFLCVPEVSSERRQYVPIGWLKPPVIPSNKLRILKDADLWHFGILTSRMHMVWTAYVGGRLESRYQYSVGINYNAFPWPPPPEEVAREDIRRLAQGVLDARAAHAGQTLADLYDPDVMPADLRRPHRALDLAVDRLYRATPFTSDRERVEHLFGLYESLVRPLTALASRRAPRRRRAQ